MVKLYRMDEKKIEKFKKLLEEEKVFIEDELRGVASEKDGDWIPKVEGGYEGDDIEIKREKFIQNQAITVNLEKRLENINIALEKIIKGTYGICEVSGEKISEERLNANPSARTSREHMSDDQ